MAQFMIRPAQAGDAQAMAELYASVAGERTGIAAEPPVDVAERAALFARSAGESVVAVADGQLIGMIHIQASRHGFGELGMLVDRGWRGRGVGSALLAAAAGWARTRGLHKLCLEVFAHNTAAIALYRKCGFREEGRRPRQYRRASGELWDTIVMGLLL
jgi:[ribosomal protein S18]-alanine N-acetyltransferase